MDGKLGCEQQIWNSVREGGTGKGKEGREGEE